MHMWRHAHACVSCCGCTGGKGGKLREEAWWREHTYWAVDEILIGEDDRRAAVAAAGERQGVDGWPEALALWHCLCVTVVVHDVVLAGVQAARECLTDGSFPEARSGDENDD